MQQLPPLLLVLPPLLLVVVLLLMMMSMMMMVMMMMVVVVSMMMPSVFLLVPAGVQGCGCKPTWRIRPLLPGHVVTCAMHRQAMA